MRIHLPRLVTTGTAGLAVATVALGSSLVGMTSAGAATGSTPAFSYTTPAPITRSTLLDGKETITDQRTVSLQVDVTTQLKDQQRIQVTWTGAHPSSNDAQDPSDSAAYGTEYPMVLLQCRDVAGTDGTVDAANPQVDPTTCWSPWGGTRAQNQLSTQPKLSPENFPAWRMDRYASVADRAMYANEPTDASASCQADSATYIAQSQLPFVAADGTKYYGSGLYNACGALPPEASISSATQNFPDNALYASTGADGTGSALFSVRDSRTNASLGCSTTVACSLVAIPIMGISCDGGAGLPEADRPAPTTSSAPWGADPTLPEDAERYCEIGANSKVGSVQNATSPISPNTAVTGALWWSASNWRNRIVVPLTFGENAVTCDNTNPPLTVYGSELLTQATASWSQHYCETSTARPLVHVQVGEPQARTAMGMSTPTTPGSVEAVFTTNTGDTAYLEPTVHAPVAATGFAISYAIDSGGGKTFTSLRLNARLLAKLMTESYPVSVLLTSPKTGWSYTSSDGTVTSTVLRKNPPYITLDPEFQALNPGIPTNVADGAGALLSLGSNSDVLYALTSYINADPEARAWLNGQPDPWGMVVNPSYQNIALPVSAWPLSDRWTTPVNPLGTCDALKPQPAFLPLVGAPVERLSDAALAILYAQPAAQTACVASNLPDGSQVFRYARESFQVPGRHFLIGITTLADAQRYRLTTAALETQSTADPTSKDMTTGRTFVAATNDSLQATATMLTYNPDTLGWDTPYATMRTSAAGAGAYPGFMLVYADVPTSGLPTGDGAAYGSLLTYIAGTGQTSGSAAGQLPAGYLPMTKANGLLPEVGYTIRAAAAVTRQLGEVPLFGSTTTTTVTTTTSGIDSEALAQPNAAVSGGAGTASGAGTISTGSITDSTSTDTAASPTTPVASPAASSPKKSSAAQSEGFSVGVHSGVGLVLLVVLLCLLILGPLGAPLLITMQRRRR